VHIRKILKNGTIYTKEGLTFTREDLKKYDEIADELKNNIAKMSEGQCEFELGNYKRLIYQANDVCIGFQKVINTNDRQDWGDVYYVSMKMFFKSLQYARADFEAKAILRKRKATNTPNKFDKRVKKLQEVGKIPKLTINTKNNTIIE